MTDARVIRVSAVVVRDPAGRVLTVRKRGTTRFMFPGGKPDAGETPAETGARELREEVGVVAEPATLRALGTFRAAAANEDGWLVDAAVFEHDEAVPVEVRPAAEIEELRWLDLTAPDLPSDLAPLIEHVLPALRGKV
ncbi:NUDIX hydrolase [Nocardioides mangrovi]|uniref:NUDIX domain-containing protein n=1 Tax=Nocardioides mangrovi TaxID=2874580 RepID=A0ABS7UBU9_9ACTN|nr:NUDIX domain-containing protein [Nocardioides mangrovi]MBZ5738314.1 NUDIX domain-containing protein [Nocardioides mangrovi]